MMADDARDQTSRWTFTLNNYANIDYRNHFSQFNFIKRCVWGKEIAPETGTPHLQGYLEYTRTMRRNTCRQVLERARWGKAVRSARENFAYCIKDGEYDTIGNWVGVERGPQAMGLVRPPSIPLILAGLCNPETSLQTKACKEYAEKFTYFDKVAKIIKHAQQANSAFTEWSQCKLYHWQYVVSFYLINFH